MSRRAQHPLLRVTALVAVLCVLALTVFAASPELHARLHTADATDHAVPVGEAGHDCVVTFFANGATVLLVFCLLAFVRSLARGVFLRAADEFAAAHPRYRLAPSHAPPAA